MRKTHALTVWAGLAIAGAGLTVATPLAAATVDPAPEVTTAALHAGMAAASSDIKMVHAHLHHTINCLVGPGGTGFDAKELNPCKDQGHGAIPDTTDAAHKRALESALEHARAGLMSEDMAKAQKSASEAQDLLKTAK